MAYYHTLAHEILYLSLPEGLLGVISRNEHFVFIHSEWDFFGYVAYPTSTVFAAVAHTFSFKGMGAALTEFAGTYTKHPSLQTGQESAVYNRVWWRIITLNLIVFPVSLCLGSFDAFYFLHEELPSSFHPFYGVIGLIQGYIFSLPSTSLGKFFNLKSWLFPLFIYHTTSQPFLN